MILFVVANAASLTASEAGFQSVLASAGYPVTLISDEAAVPSLAPYRVVVISPDCAQATIGTKYRNVPMGMVVISQPGSTTNLWGTATHALTAAAVSSQNSNSVTILPPAHPATQPYAGSVVAYAISNPISWATPAEPAVQRLMEVSAGRTVSIAYEAGAAMAGGVVAAGRRVGWGLYLGGNLNSGGADLFVKHIRWAVNNQPPTPGFTVSIAGRTVTVTSTATDVDSGIAAVAYDFGGGWVTDAVHTFPAHGTTYTITQRVTDDFGDQATAAQQVTTNALPVAAFTVAQRNAAITVTSTANDPDGSVALVEYDYGVGQGYTQATSFIFPAWATTYTVTQRVTDNHGGQSTTIAEVTTPPGPGRATTYEVALWESGAFVTHLDVEIERVSGGIPTMQSYRDFRGRNWIRSLSFTPSQVDTAIGSGKLTLHRQVGGDSLAPLVTQSPLNRDGAGYAPALDFGREIRIRTATLPPNVEPGPGDWRTVFEGFTDDIEWGGKDSAAVTVPFRDLSGRLADIQVRDEEEYGTDAGVPMETVAQDILNAMGANAPPLAVPEPTGFMVTEYRIAEVSRWQALETLVAQRGAVLRQEWNEAAGAERLTLVIPPREKSTPDYAVGPSTYLDVHQVKTGGANLRTILRAYAYAHGTGAELMHQIPAEADVANDPKVIQYGELFMQLAEESSSAIDTMAELIQYVTSAYADVSDPPIPIEPETKYCWFARPDQMVQWLPNGLLWDEGQECAVLGVTHEFPAPGVGRTRWRGAGKAKGAYREWTRKGVALAGSNAVTLPRISTVPAASSPTSATYTITGYSSAGDPVLLFLAMGSEPFGATPVANPLTLTLTLDEVSGVRQTARVKAVSRGGETERLVSPTFDAVPTLEPAPAPAPIYAGNAQVGWKQEGTGGLLAGAVRVRLTGGATFARSTPQAVAAGTDYWLNLATNKAFSVEVDQAPGAAAALETTPFEAYGPSLVPAGSSAAVVQAASGAEGEPLSVPLRRAPVTEYTPQNVSASTRTVLFTANPSGSELRYRLAGGAWVVVPNVAPSHTTPVIDVSAGDVTVEFYGVSTAGVVSETPRSFVLDQNAAAEVKTLNVVERTANHLTATTGIDDDTFTWAVFARKGSSPEDRADNPIPGYLVGIGGRASSSVTWYASAGTWYVFARAYDAQGVYDPALDKRDTVVVTGSPSSAGYLSDVAGALQEDPPGSGAWWNRLLWNHSASIDAAAAADWTVDITEDGAALVAGRPAKYDTGTADDGTGGVVVAGQGGARRAVQIAAPGDPYGQQRTFAYTVTLKHLGAVVASYPATVSGFYAGSGEPEPAPGAADPPVLEVAGAAIRATWAPSANNDWDIQWEYASSQAGPWTHVSVEQVPRPGGERYYFQAWTGWYYRALLRRRTNAGPGAWSAPSNVALFGSTSGGGGGGTEPEIAL